MDRAPDELSAWDAEKGLLHVLVDTPRGSRPKYKVDAATGRYVVAHILPPGTVFPFDFGSVPSTLADDGDPLDVLVLIEEATFPGCLLKVRLVGVLEAKQTHAGKTDQNDRFIGVSDASRAYRDIRALSDVPKKVLDEIEHFFVAYNKERGRRFRVVKRSGAARAHRLIREGERRYRKGR
jgi:inorganic pyrophosphatase